MPQRIPTLLFAPFVLLAIAELAVPCRRFGHAQETQIELSGEVLTIVGEDKKQNQFGSVEGALIVAIPEKRVPETRWPKAPRIVICQEKQFVPSIVAITPGQIVELRRGEADMESYTIVFLPRVSTYTSARLSQDSPAVRFQVTEKGVPFTSLVDGSIPKKNCRILTCESPYHAYSDSKGRFTIEIPEEFGGKFRVIAYGPASGVGKSEVIATQSAAQIRCILDDTANVNQ